MRRRSVKKPLVVAPKAKSERVWGRPPVPDSSLAAVKRAVRERILEKLWEEHPKPGAVGKDTWRFLYSGTFMSYVQQLQDEGLLQAVGGDRFVLTELGQVEARMLEARWVALMAEVAHECLSRGHQDDETQPCRL